MNDSSDGITVEREFDAPIERVWASWTKPDLVKQWWGPEGFYAPSIAIDLKEGGRYVFCMHGPRGSEFDADLYSAGVYETIIPPGKNGSAARLSMTDYFSDEHGNKVPPSAEGMSSDMPDEMRLSVRFEPLSGGRTKLTVTYPRPENDRQFAAMKQSGMADGWHSSLNKLEQALKPKGE